MAWLNLILAGLLEIIWTAALKLSNGFSNFLPTVATTAVTFLSYYFLAQALKTIPMGTTYAVLAGVGAIGTVAVGITLFGETYNMARFACVGLIVVGVVGLRIL